MCLQAQVSTLLKSPRRFFKERFQMVFEASATYFSANLLSMRSLTYNFSGKLTPTKIEIYQMYRIFGIFSLSMWNFQIDFTGLL